jgi:DtxR family Mn-dependent transcriptional regulator
MTQSTKIPQEGRPTPTIEDYLAIIYVLERDSEAVIPARLAESMDVAPPTVTTTLKRMERDGWIANDPIKGIYLTDHGCDAASSVIRRHMLTEWMLARMLKVPWSRVHSAADQIEHTISDDIEDQMRTNLDDPQLCPHGNPLPGYEYVTADWVPLTGLVPGNKVIIRRIHESAEDNRELLAFLEENGIVPGARAEVIEVLPFNQTLSLQLENEKVTLGFSTARFISVDITA